MRRKRKHHSGSHPHRKHPHSFNFVSGLIYAFAAILTISFGALFYNGIRNAQKQLARSTADSEALNSDVPPGARVVLKSDGTSSPAPAPQPAPPVQPAMTSAVAQEPARTNETLAPTQTVAEAIDALPIAEAKDQALPAPTLLPPVSWPAPVVDPSLLQRARLLVTADTGILASPEAAREKNGGSAPELLLKGNDAFILAAFNTEKVAGWTVSKATWHVKLKRGQPRAIGFSSVFAPWTEGTGTLRESSQAGASFLWADGRAKPWRPGNEPLTAVIRGNSGSPMAVGSPKEKDIIEDQWVSIPIDPVIVQNLIAGVANGIVVTDEKGRFGADIIFYSRENTNDVHYIDLEGALVDMQPPGPIQDLMAYAHPALQRSGSAGVVLTWTAPGDDAGKGQAFAYDIRYAPAPAVFETAKPLPPHLRPRPQPAGAADKAVVPDLDSATLYTFFVRALDETGQGSPAASVNVRTTPRLEAPVVPQPEAFATADIDVAGNKIGFNVCDPCDVPDPAPPRTAAGAARSPQGRSYVWDRSSRTLKLCAARNETVDFLLLLTSKGPEFPEVQFKVEPFDNPKGKLTGAGVKFHRVWYSYNPATRTLGGDALIPFEDKLQLKSPANGISNQTSQAVLAEIHVPADANPGTYVSQLVIGSGGMETKINTILEVLPVDLPAKPRFTIELGAPPNLAMLYKKDVVNTSEAGPVELAYHRAAHDHRCVLALLPYLRNGQYTEPFAPAAAGKGIDLLISGWAAWDQRFGKYLGEEAFAGSGNGPLPHIILPVFENWPTPFQDGFLCIDKEQPAAGGLKVFTGPGEELRSCLSTDYWRAWRAALTQFRDHLRARDGQGIAAHVWLNNVPSANYSGKPPPWSLGAPLYRDDFLALDAYAEIAAGDLATWPQGGLLFRANVPDAAALGTYGSSRFSLLLVEDSSPWAWTLLRERTTITGEKLWLLTDNVPQGEAAVEATALRAFLEGAEGWAIRETVGRPEQWLRASPQSLLYCGARLGAEAPAASLRLKSLRRAEQEIEYLLLLQEKMGWTRQQLRDCVVRQVPAFADGSEVTAEQLHVLRNAVQQLLTK